MKPFVIKIKNENFKEENNLNYQSFNLRKYKQQIIQTNNTNK
jgi:hypothetical protein